MKILITGCSGFIGFHLCQKILQTKKNFKIVGVDNLNDYYSVPYKKKRLSFLKKNKNFTFHKIDISNYKKIKKIFSKNKFDFVINLAAQAGVRYSITNPKEYIDSNISGFFNIAELCRIYSVQKIYYASSSSVYGEKKKFPLIENEKLNPKNIYSLSKKNNEEIAEIYSNYYNLQFIGFRFFTIYGEWGRPDMLILRYMLDYLNKKTFYLNNYGDHYRDFTYVEDLVRAIRLLIDTPPSQDEEMEAIPKNDNRSSVAPFRVVNIGNSDKVRLLDFIEAVENELGIKARRNMMPMQMGDVPATWANADLLHDLTGYKPETNYKEGVRKFIGWYKEYYNV